MTKNNVNYAKIMQKQLESLAKDTKPRLLLHVCCGPCLTVPYQEIADYFDVTIYYENSNIYPKAEYDRRLSELQRYILENNYKIEVIAPRYDNEKFNIDLEPYKDLPEGFKRCHICFEKRLTSLFKFAQENGYEYCASSLTISRYKNAQIVNQIGSDLEQKFPPIKWLYSDFKKQGGYEKSLLICREYDLYFQEYCGCKYSYKKWQEKLKNKQKND